MRIQNGTRILVTDGRKMLLFANEGDADYPNLKLLEQHEHPDPADRAQKADAAGRTTFRGARRASAYEEADFHVLDEARFAALTAKRLNEEAQSGQLGPLVIAADPHTLGELRRHYRAPLQRSIVAEIAKDLVKHPVAEIERILVEE